MYVYMYTIHRMGDVSEKGIQQSFGMMVNYHYVLENVEQNNSKYLLDGVIPIGDDFKALV